MKKTSYSKHQKDQRACIERRQFNYAACIPERRSGQERRATSSTEGQDN